MERAPVERRISPAAGLLVVVAIGFVVLGFVYFTRTSAHLPSYLPGHYEPSRLPGHVAQARKHHWKLGVLCFALAVVAIASASFVAAEDASERVP
jgi:hypothetical protein